MSRKVIGIDLGGTKLLGGVVDEQLEVHDRVHRLVEGLSEQALVEAIVEPRPSCWSSTPTWRRSASASPA